MPVSSAVRAAAVPAGAPTYMVEPVLSLATSALQYLKNDLSQG